MEGRPAALGMRDCWMLSRWQGPAWESGSLQRPGSGTLCGLAGSEALEHLREAAGVGDLAVGRQVVDQVRQESGHHARELGRVEAMLRRGLLQRSAVKNVLELIRGDRKILAGADPRADHMTEAALLEHLLQTSNAADLRVVDIAENGADSGGVFLLLRA
jgi:hypothetical protein